MKATLMTDSAGPWIRLIMVFGVAIPLTICWWSPSRGQERHGACEEQGETIVVYDCRTGLVLWSRGHSKELAPIVTSERELCRLVVGRKSSALTEGQCL